MEASVSRKWKTIDMAYIALFAVLMAVCSWISIPAVVPFTLQTFGVFVAVSVLGGKRGTLAVVLYLLMGIVGLPVFAGFSGGLGVLLGSTGGYIIGFVFTALVMWLIERLLGTKTWVLALSMLLALAMCMPEGEVRLYFVLPIRMKWMLIFELVYLGYQVVRIFSIGIASYGTGMGILVGVLNCVQIVVPVLNMFWFFHAMKTRLSGKQKKRQKEFRAQFSQPRPGSGIARHKCAICGRTELTNPELQFRYCSKCVGNREYCQDHLFTHQHVK